MKMQKTLFLLLFIICLGPFLLGYTASVISGALLFLKQEFSLSLFEEGMAASILSLGALGGTLCAGILADKWGRRSASLVMAACYLLGSFLVLSAPVFFLFLLGRLVTGFAIGLSCVLTSLYTIEIAPLAYRGAFIASGQLATAMGTFLAYGVNHLFLSQGWRLMLGLAAIPAAIQLVGLFFLPESPRWLLRQNRQLEADKVIQRLSLQEIVEQGEALSPKANRSSLFSSSRLRKALLIGLVMTILQQITGINAILYYAPKIFQSAGYASFSEATWATFLMGIVNLIASALSIFLLHRYGRKSLFLSGLAGVGGSLLWMGLFSLMSHTKMVVVGVMVFNAFFASTLGPVSGIAISEIFPSWIRGKAMGITAFANSLTSYFVCQTFLSLAGSWGIGGIFFLYAFFAVAGIFFVGRYMQETKGKSLEEIDREFTY